MTVSASGLPPSHSEPVRGGKYARIERERRFLLAEPPPASVLAGRRQITDRYLPGTRLRLRRIDWEDGSRGPEFKFTQKVAAGRPGHVRGLITNTYLSATEYEMLAALPADVLRKTRFSMPPLAVDIFEPPLHGLVLAEAEFGTDEAALSLPVPAIAVAEITDDSRFAGGSLVRADRSDLLAWLADYGVAPISP